MAKEAKKKETARAKKKCISTNGLRNTFRMVILASRRAKEILMGDKPLIETANVHPCLIALEEIKKGKVKYKEAK